jgi:DNA-binding transcriptional regulator YiaG
MDKPPITGPERRQSDVERLVQYRKKHGISLEKLAQLLGVSWMTVRRWEHKFHAPSPLAARQIATFLAEHEGL